MSHRLARPLIHGAWQTAWWGGRSPWSLLLGPAPRLEALEQAAERVSAHPPAEGWNGSIHPLCRHKEAPKDALVVLAGQQPVLGGGAALVAHKAATAIALAKQLTERWGRPVVPVFLLATQDHDSSEVDHLDFISPLNGSLTRSRCPIHPKNEMFSKARWNSPGFNRFKHHMVESQALSDSALKFIIPGSSLSDHVATLLDRTFGDQGLYIVEAHRLPQGPTAAILSRALQEPAPLAEALSQGAISLDEVQRSPSFDPADPRPLVLESRGGRRKRLEPDDRDAAKRLSEDPVAFSPHAALRPIVQASCLPVVAQVCGPSEIVYLGQARQLHSLFGVPAPALVPRMEATHLSPAVFAEHPDPAELLMRLDLKLSPLPAQQAERDLLAAAHKFSETMRAQDPGLSPQLHRFEERLNRNARRLAEAPTWRRRGELGSTQAIHPRGRYQDATLAWLPQAWLANDPAGWGRHIVSLAQPMAEPKHVVHAYPESSTHG